MQSADLGMLPGPFAYAERWDEGSQTYLGLAIEKAGNAWWWFDSDSVIVNSDVAEANRPAPIADQTNTKTGDTKDRIEDGGGGKAGPAKGGATSSSEDKLPTRFIGTVMISPDRPAREIHQIVEAIIEQLTTLPGSEVSLKLEIDAEVPAGLDRAKVRTLLENAATLGFIDKVVE